MQKNKRKTGLSGKMSIITFVLILSTSAFAFEENAPRGALWYNLPIAETSTQEIKPEIALSATKRSEIFRLAATEALNIAIENPTEENINTYRIMQNFAVNRASNFTWKWL